MIKELELHDEMLMLLLKKKLNDSDKKRVDELVHNVEFNWEMFLGRALFNRVNGVVYKNIKEFNDIPREVYIALNLMYCAQVERNEHQKEALKKISNVLLSNNIKHAFLKGSVLNSIVYGEGERISNDVDILINSDDINKVTELFENEGFVQGTYDRDTEEIIEASRKRKMFIRATTHEISSFVKKEESIFFKVNSIDVNFKLSAIDSVETTRKLLENTSIIEKDGIKLSTLKWEYFIIQLASHLYREAISVTKIVYGSDLHMYKFYDFYALLKDSSIAINWDEVVSIANDCGQSKAVYYALYCVNKLFDDCIDGSVLPKFGVEDNEYIDMYVGKQGSNEVYKWKEPFEKRFFNYKRKVEANNNIKDIASSITSALNNL